MVVSRRTPVGLKVFTRAAWTDEKDDFLIQLLLAQVNAGRFADSRFSKESWNEIMTSFNRRFDANSNLTQIKSRFQQLKKSYFTFQKLIEHEDFGWDSERLLPTAPSDVWEAYLKHTPHAKDFRTKTLSQYEKLHDLCRMINGGSSPPLAGPSPHAPKHMVEVNVDKEAETLLARPQLPLLRPHPAPEAPEERAPKRLKETHPESDVAKSVLSIGVGAMADVRKSPMTAAAHASPSRASWSEARDVYLIQLLLYQVGAGKRGEFRFKKEAWLQITNCFNLKFTTKFTVIQLKTRFQQLKKKFSIVQNMREHADFEWDNERSVPTASPETWEAYLKHTPQAREFRNHPLSAYALLSELMSDAPASERDDSSASNRAIIETDVANDMENSSSVFAWQASGVQRDASQVRLVSADPTRSITENEQFAKAIAAITKALEDKQANAGLSVASKAIVILEDAYSGVLSKEDMATAFDVMLDEKKAAIFSAMKDGETRTMWLKRHIDAHNE